MFGLRVPDYDGTVMFYREIKSKIGFDVVISKEVYRGHRCEEPQIYSMPTDVCIYESRCLKVQLHTVIRSNG